MQWVSFRRDPDWDIKVTDKFKCRYPTLQELIHYIIIYPGIGLEIGFKHRANINIFPT